MKIKELREKSNEELKAFLKEKKELAGKLRFDISSKQSKNHREFRKAKKTVAQILTLLNEKVN